MFDYTLVLTSCARHSLLKRTLDSFIKYADVKPVKTVIGEDGGLDAPGWMNEDYVKRGLPNLVWIKNCPKLGQIPNIDKVYSNVETEYFFHLEDDFEFLETGFMEESYKILEAYPEVSQCNLRGWEWFHPSVDDSRFPFKLAQPGFCGFWGGLSWNPGLRRSSDYKNVFGTFMELVPSLPSEFNGVNAQREAYFSKMMLDRGYVVAALKKYCIDIGRDYHVSEPGYRQ